MPVKRIVTMADYTNALEVSKTKAIVIDFSAAW